MPDIQSRKSPETKMELKKLISFFSLFTSLGTLICCALPALLVSVGLGAVMAGLASNLPGLVWISEHKLNVFIIAAGSLMINGLLIWRGRNAACPLDPELRAACLNGRRISRNIYFLSLIVFMAGFFFAYVAPHFL